MEPGLGNHKHTHHSPINAPSKQKNKRRIAQDEQDLINDIAEGLGFNSREMEKLQTNISFRRTSLNLKEQKYMMSFVWVNPDELSLLEAFPEVIMIDTTEKTNNEKIPLLTAGGKDTNGKISIFLRVFMPNQQSWMF